MASLKVLQVRAFTFSNLQYLRHLHKIFWVYTKHCLSQLGLPVKLCEIIWKKTKNPFTHVLWDVFFWKRTNFISIMSFFKCLVTDILYLLIFRNWTIRFFLNLFNKPWCGINPEKLNKTTGKQQLLIFLLSIQYWNVMK